jgi:hypothetical protein
MFSCLDAAQQSQLARVLSSAQSRLSLLCEPPGPGNSCTTGLLFKDTQGGHSAGDPTAGSTGKDAGHKRAHSHTTSASDAATPTSRHQSGPSITSSAARRALGTRHTRTPPPAPHRSRTRAAAPALNQCHGRARGAGEGAPAQVCEGQHGTQALGARQPTKHHASARAAWRARRGHPSIDRWIGGAQL